MTQCYLSDATGLTAVHVNRTMRDLRKAGLIALQRRRLMIPDLAMLEETASFDPAYLHLNGVDARAR